MARAGAHTRAHRASKALVLSVVAGGLAGAAWALARSYGRDRADQLFDWDQVVGVALRSGAKGPPLDGTRRAELESDYRQILRDIAEPLRAYTGTALDVSQAEVHVLDRAQWIRTNAANLHRLFEPLEQWYRESDTLPRTRLPGIAALGRVALSGEVGMLLGYLARRVLGQYDITLLSRGPLEPGKLYFVEPNIQAVQLQLGVPHREFRLWLALHEATHAHEFEGHPWVRDYLDSTLQGYLQTMVEHLGDGNGSFASGLKAVADHLLGGQTLIEAVMTPTQREFFLRLQALMTVLEGYSTHVMSAVGSGLLPYYPEIERRVEARLRQKSAVELLFLRLTGLQLKFDQYRLGAAFVAYVERERGAGFANRLWEGPENLPTLDEIKEPARWVARMDRVAA